MGVLQLAASSRGVRQGVADIAELLSEANSRNCSAAVLFAAGEVGASHPRRALLRRYAGVRGDPLRQRCVSAAVARNSVPALTLCCWRSHSSSGRL